MVRANQIIDALQCGHDGCSCLRASGSKGNVHCPAHIDKNPSLSITEEDGKLLVYCHGGCHGGQVITELRDRGLWPEQGYKVDNRKWGTTGRKTRYEIRSLDDVLIAVHMRVDYQDRPKKVWWEQPDGSNGLNGLKSSTLPLFGSEYLPALDDGAEVVVTEGEPAAKALRDLGIEAVGTVTGASGTPGDEALSHLVRLRVVLWADNDDAGRQHMARVAARLSALECLGVP